MNDILPPQLEMFLALIRPLRDGFNARYTHWEAEADQRSREFDGYFSRVLNHLSGQCDVLSRQFDWLNTCLNQGGVSRALMQAEVARLEQMVTELLSDYLYLSRQIVPSEVAQAQYLLLTIMRRSLTNIQDGVNRMVKELENPLACGGRLNVSLNVQRGTERLWAELQRWMDSRTAGQRGVVLAVPSQNSAGGGVLEGVLGVWLGVEIAEHLFDKDKD